MDDSPHLKIERWGTRAGRRFTSHPCDQTAWMGHPVVGRPVEMTVSMRRLGIGLIVSDAPIRP
jgi:hypothetical protein